jgi:maltooligosyltrehalose trehalohydrolase
MIPLPAITKRTLGVTFPFENRANVLLWAPSPQYVAIKLTETSEIIPLKNIDYGYWQLTTSQIRPGTQYTFILDNESECQDPASLFQPEGILGPSEAVDTTTFYWEDQSWVNPPLEDYLLYELHTGTFTPEGTFSAIEDKLDYLKTLGITAIELMPVAQFSNTRNWGYDGVFAYAAQNTYGGARALQKLINACHFRGIAVVLDVVYNHFGPEGNFLSHFGPYLTSKYCTPWGDAVNYDDAWCDGVRHYVIENALMWFRDFHIDALRLDAVHAIKDFSPVHILQELKQHVDGLMKMTGRRYYLIVENDLNDPRFITPLAEQGYGMDAQWIDEFHHSLRVTVGEERIGYYADFTGINHLEKAYRDAYVYDGQFSEVRQKLFGSKATSGSGQQFVVFSQNHDQVGNRKEGERTSQLFDFETLKLLAGAVLVSPYVPMLFMGEEWGETNPFFYFVSLSEPELIETVRQGRQDEFSDFHSDGEVPDPQSRETFRQAKLQWELICQEPHQTLLRYYQTLIALRKQLPALHHLERQRSTIISYENQQTLVLHRWYEDQQVLCLMNFSKQPQAVSQSRLISGSWEKILDSSDTQWQTAGQHNFTSGSTIDSSPDSMLVQAQSIAIYAQGHEKYHINLP